MKGFCIMYKLISNEPDLVFACGTAKIRLQPVDAGIVRVTMTQRDNFLPWPETKDQTPIVTCRDRFSSYRLEEDETSYLIRLPKCTVSLAKKTGALSYFNAQGRLFVKEPSLGGKTPVEKDVVINEFSENAKVTAVKSVDGMKAVSSDYTPRIDRTGYRAKVEFVFDTKEALFGFGSHEEGYGNLRGKSRQIYQQNMKACIPSFVSTKGYGFLFNCCSMMTFEDNGYGSYVWEDIVDELDYYFIGGGSYSEVLKGYRKLTGEAPLLPKWVFGYGQSKEHYQSASELISVVKEYRKRNIPLDYIIQDWLTWEDGLWGQKSFDASRYPDPEGMMKEIHDMGAHAMISIWPNMQGNCPNQLELQKEGKMLGNQSTYNAFDSHARHIYWKQAEQGIFKYGLDGWWCDCTEPFESDWKGVLRPEPHERAIVNTTEAKKYLDPTQISAYSLNHSRGVYEGQRSYTQEKRVVNLTRSSYAGQHRYATITWSGDTSSSWDTLKRQIPEGTSFSAAGEPYWNMDIGGFFPQYREDLWFFNGQYNGGCEDLGYRELYTRWLQYGTFLPMMRSHGTYTPREIWNFGEEGTMFYDSIAKFIRLRSSLIPYLYSLAGGVTFHDSWIILPPALAFPQDTKTYDLLDEFMFGPAFLVCPVTEPMYYEAESVPLYDVPKTRDVYLPAGQDWYDFWTDTQIEGGQKVTADAPIDRIPLYVKAGSILPLGPELSYVKAEENPPLTLRIYPGQDGEFVLYEDEGDSYRYEQNQYSNITFSWKENTHTFVISRRNGSYPGMPEKRQFFVELAGQPESRREIEYCGDELAICF